MKATGWFMEQGMKNPDNAGAGSMDFLYLLGLLALGYEWAQMAKIAKEKLAAGDGDPAFWNNKLILARFFMERMIPDTSVHLAKLQTGADTVMAMTDAAF
jgi:hypothetical protein